MTFIFTPLEQFDQAVWLSHYVRETLNPYALFISESEFAARELYVNTYSASVSSISFATLRQSESQVRLLLVVVGLINHFSPLVAKQAFSFRDGFAHLFFLGAINLFTGVFLVIWFTDFFFIREEVSSVYSVDSLDSTFNYIFAPQVDISLSIDERRITLILGFFLFGGNESEDESDFVFQSEGDLTIVEDVVAPLFVANLGKDIAENGALYLKVCAIFGFVLISNLRGRIPYGDTATSSLILTF